MPTIAEIATTDDRFDSLVQIAAFIDQALPGSGLVAALSDPAADLTVFAPTNTAFEALARSLGWQENQGPAADFLIGGVAATLLRDIVTYHVSPGAKTLAELNDLAEIAILNGETITPDGPSLIDAEPDLIDPSIVQRNVHADNGIIQVIDRVLLPTDLPGNDAASLLDLVAGTGFDQTKTDFDILSAAVAAAGLDAALDDPGQELTVFAPTDRAFESLARALGFVGHSEEGVFNHLVESLTLLSGGASPLPLLTDILRYHVVGEELQASEVLASREITTLLGADLVRNGTRLGDAEPDLRDPALVLTALDLPASNGVAHVIDGVLIPADLLVSNGANQVDFIIAGNADDRLRLGADNDYADGNGGSDLIRGGAGNDTVLGGLGADDLLGDGGRDLLVGEGGADLLLGDGGADRLVGGGGQDRLIGGRGADTFVFAGAFGTDRLVDFQTGADRLDLTDLNLADFDALRALMTENEGDTTIRIDGQTALILEGMGIGDLNARDVLL